MKEGTRAVSDFPTLALSRSGDTGISQPSRRRAPRVVEAILVILQVACAATEII
ncbi:hypothetical protein EFER_2191 [Escherichia fergusonii ATCC 35469]|uniref:Uncharacterized protein n=1 Tax=Escherichia fergusonii (strain ATCC 35469 / DSM 13698 / CCUG 18766 / IAM 14443 / JCM 21226 / LMG 7866 / NBRC 102419 / NCTC 12128 / CDC 0568-73) TaxID=585054 RepID=B7LV67_ESCF3|nr:hypothetical protein EFER_2191 [Escherichia fergusonii ATCC 35469]